MRYTILHIILLALASVSCRAQVVIQAPSTAHPTIQSAINAAASGHVVEVLPGTYFENLLVDGKTIEIRAQQRGSVTIDGGGFASCLVVQQGADLTFDGFILTNGQGTAQPVSYINQTFGGGIWVRAFDFATPSVTAPATLTARFCQVTGNQATTGAAMYVDYLCSLTMEDSSVTWNNGSLSAGIQSVQGMVDIRRCEFANNGPAIGGVWVTGLLNLSDSTIHDVSIAAVSWTAGEIRRCRILDCDVALISFSTGGLPKYEIYDTLISGCGHQTSTFPILRFPSPTIISGCTIVNNIGPSTLPTVEAIDNCQLTIDNSIVRGNAGPDFGTAILSPWPINGPPPAVFATHCCLTTINNSGPGNIALDPLFVDATSDDYRLRPGSPCVDAGDQTLPNVSQTDITGGARVLLGDVDIGCYEARALAHHPASAGRVGESAGGPYEILKINGQTGGATRTVSVPVGTASTVAVQQAPVGTLGAKFVIFGFLGEADVQSVVNVPLGIGDMMFAPQPMVPAFLHWLFFTYTDNFNPAAPQFVASTPTPWNSGLGPAIPFPLTITFQAVLEESPGVYVPTNAVIFRVE